MHSDYLVNEAFSNDGVYIDYWDDIHCYITQTIDGMWIEGHGFDQCDEREDLLSYNLQLARDIYEEIKKYPPNWKTGDIVYFLDSLGPCKLVIKHVYYIDNEYVYRVVSKNRKLSQYDGKYTEDQLIETTEEWYSEQ